jgi:hypothetical protein
MTTSIYTAQGRMTLWPATSTPNIWKTDLAMSRLSPSKNAAKRSPFEFVGDGMAGRYGNVSSARGGSRHRGE